MDTRLFPFVWRHSRKQQLVILALTVSSFPLVYASLEIPKIIVNEAINGTEFPRDIFGLQLEQIPYLLFLCATFLVLVVMINALKWLINVSIGMCGERMLRRLRFMLFEHLMRFRTRRLRSTRSGDAIQSILGEIEPLGGFIGELIATPVFQGGLLTVYVTFIFVQDVWLGFAAVSLYPVQAWLIPKLQRKIIVLNKARARNVRGLADQIGESIGSIQDIQTNDTARWHLAQLSTGLFRNTQIRLALFRRKFTIKFINNFMNQLTPFFFYSVGGYLVIKGELNFGSLVAVLAAYKDLAGPWKTLLNYYQRLSDFNSRFINVVESFVGEDVHPPERVWGAGRMLNGPMELIDIEGGPGTSGLTIPRLELHPGQTVAILGGAGGARDATMQIMAGLAEPAAGRIRVGERLLTDATLPEIGRTLAYVGPSPGLVTGTVRQNLLYGLFRHPPVVSEGAGPELAEMLREARLTGNLTTDPEGDWVDYEAAGVRSPAELQERLLELIDIVGLSDDLYSTALNSRLTPEEASVWNASIMNTRTRLRPTIAGLEDLVEEWDAERYNTNGTVLANLLFGLPVRPTSDVSEYLDQSDVADVLSQIGAFEVLEEIGWDIAVEFQTLVEAVGEASGVLDTFPVYGRSEIQDAATLVAGAAPRGRAGLGKADRTRLHKLALRFVETRDSLDVLGQARKAKVLEARARARKLLAHRPDFVGFDEERFSPARTVAENILHARRRFDRKSAWKRLDEYLEQAIVAEGLRLDLIGLGLKVPLLEGDLSAPGRRKAALVRAMIKRPAFLLLDGIADGDGEPDRALRASIRRILPDCCLIYAAANETAAGDADLVVTVDDHGTVKSVGPIDNGRKQGGDMGGFGT